MKVRIVRIGNSQGIRIPKAILRQCRLGDTVEMQVEGNRLILKAASHPRAGWEEAFRRMARRGHDRLLDREVLAPTEWEKTEWKW